MTTELEKWCQKHGIALNSFEEVFGGLNIPPDWAEEVYKMGQRSRDMEVLSLFTQVKALTDLLRNIGTHLHLETKRRWWQRKTK